MENNQPIIIKRVKRFAAGHHGGAWKIAFADFATAMMAFFLVMWLLSVATPKQREGIAEHFKMPLKVALAGGDRGTGEVGGDAERLQRVPHHCRMLPTCDELHIER